MPDDLIVASSTGSHGSHHHRMDRSNVEPRDRVHQDQRRVCQLLRRAHGQAPAGHGAAELR